MNPINPGGAPNPSQDPEHQTIDMEYVPIGTKGILRNKIVFWLAAISAVGLLVLWIRGATTKFLAGIHNFGGYGKALGILTLIGFLIWFVIFLKRKWRIRRDRRSENPDNPASTPASGRRTFWKVVIWMTVLSLLVVAGFWIIQIARFSSPYQQPENQLLAVNGDALCTDTSGKYLEYHRESPSNTDFYETFPEGCGTLVALPKEYGHEWRLEYAGDRTVHKHIYVRDQCTRTMLACPAYQGPADLLSNRPIPASTLAFYIQPAQHGDLRIHFRTDRPPVVVPTTLTVVSASQTKPTTPSQSGRRIYSAGEVEVTPKALHIVPVEMTDEAVRAKFSGTIPVAIVVEFDGSVDEIHLLKDVGFGLDANIAKALGQWKFDPGTKDRLPVPVRMIIDISLPPNSPASH